MSKLLVLASLCFPLAAHADAPAKPQVSPAQPKACAGGELLIASEHKDLGIDVGSAGITIWEKGAVHVYAHDPKAMFNLDVMACLGGQERKDLRAALAKAAWKITANAIACQAVSATHTVWTSGKHSFDDVLCGHETIDADTREAFVFVTGLETAYAKTAPKQPPPTHAPAKPTAAT